MKSIALSTIQIITIFFIFLVSENQRLIAQNNCNNLEMGTFSLCDNFEDGDFTNNPIWQGETDKFIVNTDQELQLNSESTDVSHLVTSITNTNLSSETTVWQFFLKTSFSASNNNNIKIYLLADNIDLEGGTNGYFLQIGENGSDDAIELYEQNGSETTLLVRGIEGEVAESINKTIKITLENGENWRIETADAQSSNFVESASVTSAINTSLGADFFGLVCKYSATNATKFYFDNFYIGQPIIDSQAPELLNLTVDNSTQLTLEFSEAINTATFNNTTNYLINNTLNPSSINNTNETSVQLTFGTPFENGQNTIRIQNLADNAGNVISTINTDFFYTKVSVNDIVINEIFPDPSPSVGLPQFEFVELYNRTDLPIDLTNWSFTDNFPDIGAFFPNASIPAKGYLLICPIGDAETAYQSFGNVVGLAGFPSLNNSSDALALLDKSGDIITTTTYSSSWYKDSSKDGGGYTLERIRSENLCEGGDNWAASFAENGGTPATENSVVGQFPDEDAPQVLNVNILNNTSIELTFDETLDATTASNSANYTINNDISIAEVLEEINSVTLLLNEPLVVGTSYTLTLNMIADCLGNVIENIQISLALPQSSAAYDVLFNEIFVDFSVPEELPQPNLDLPAAEYVELFNRSEKTISLENWSFIDATDTTTLDTYLLLPNQYVLLCSESKADLFIERGWPSLGVKSFPSLNDSGDDLLLVNEAGMVMDGVSYSRAWYKSEVKEQGGWSLERIDTDNPCEGSQNWGASTAEVGGTPAAVNSIIGENKDTQIPDLLRVEVINRTLVQAFFSEPLNRNAAIDPSFFSIDNGVGTPISASILAPDFTQVLLELNTSLQENTIYKLTANNITDCAGNIIGVMNTAQLGITTLPELGDLVINELLFNPSSDGTDFIELYNNSNKIIDLSGWFVGNADWEENPDSIINIEPISRERYSIFPDQYVVLADLPTLGRTDYVAPLTNIILEEYGTSGCNSSISAAQFISINLPIFSNDDGVVAITDIFGTTILDKVQYSSDWHFQLLDTKDGVSLERISADQPSQDANNWQSSAANNCYATPTYANSQSTTATTPTGDFTIEPKVFSPDNDGFNDFANISFDAGSSETTINIKIFDARGREVRHLVKNELAGLTANYKWDGLTETGEKARLGIYVVHAEAFDTNGDVERFRETCVLGGKLE